MDDLLDEFVAEARDMLEALSSEVVAWEADPADADRLGAIFRFVHTIKGNCGFFDLPRLERLSHAAEDLLGDCRAGRRRPDQALVSAVLEVLDRIALIVDGIATGVECPATDDARLIEALGDASDTVLPVSEDVVAGDGDEDDAAAVDADVQAAPGAGNRAIAQRTIRLPIDLLDRVMSGVSEMAVARNELARKLHDASGDTDLVTPFNRLSVVLDDLGAAIARIRMQPIETLFAGLPRLVRDLSRDLGKQAVLTVDDGDVEIDRELVEVVRDPLLHIIRNALDHGLETPEQRLAAGKPEAGKLSITARQTGSEIRIGVVDDGRGIDPQALVERAIAAGVTTAEAAAAMTPRERNMLVCTPGLSTKGEVTSISGRGVGMDLVRANIERLGGSLVIDSTPGSGTRMMLNVPLSLSIIPSLTVGVGEHLFALPRSYVDEIVHASGEGVRTFAMGGRSFIELRGEQVPCAGLEDLLHVTSAKQARDRLYLLIKLVGGDVFGLAVDAIHDHQDLVIKPISPVIMGCGFYVGATQLDDGRPVPMLDVAGIARGAGMIGEVRHIKVSEPAMAKPVEEKPLVPALMFVGFDGHERAIEMSAVARLEKIDAAAARRGRDGSTQVVLDDRIVPLLGIDGDLPTGQLRLLRIEDGLTEIAFAIARMVDLIEFDPAKVKQQGRAGQRKRLALVDGRPVELLDKQAVLAAHAASAAEGV
ncbi:MAG: chemotaxis protein CheW [Erythrobacter sp.]|nr:chemotaxis protein CheW [Erythrobacter sp.]